MAAMTLSSPMLALMLTGRPPGGFMFLIGYRLVERREDARTAIELVARSRKRIMHQFCSPSAHLCIDQDRGEQGRFLAPIDPRMVGAALDHDVERLKSALVAI